MTKKYDTLVYLGRFQPVHNIHIEILRRACELAREVIVIIGSARQPRTFKNPFNAHERKMMLTNVLDQMDIGNTRVHIESNFDTIYDDTAWAARVQAIVSKYRVLGGSIGLIGHKKDAATADYLEMFPQWEREEIPLLEPLNATQIREMYFQEKANMNFIRGVVPQPVFRLMEGWYGTPEFLNVLEERRIVEEIRRPYLSLPYPPIFSTSDACVFQSGHVLLIRRRAAPGKGLWAFPGGYVNALTDKSVKSAAIRELNEESRIKLPTPVLERNIIGDRVFDAIDRSPRGRIITHAFKIDLEGGQLPKIKGEDDADKARWWPISEVQPEIMFEDHWDIFQWALGVTRRK